MEIDNVVDLDKVRDSRKPHFSVMALCLSCHHKWIGTVLPETSLFGLECPKCNTRHSFASLLTDDYVDAIRGT